MKCSVYVHIPFCSRRCDYCDFATWVDKSDRVQEYIDTVITQWLYHRDVLGPRTVNSIFFGGGTPNLLDAIHITRIIETISNKWTLSSDTEITVESNPDHITHDKLSSYVSAGVNRISLGIQSTNETTLSYLGREHRRENIFTARDKIATAGITNVNGDLIYGSPTEDLEQWKETLQEVLTLDLSHISAYALGIEPGTQLSRDISTGKKQSINDDDLADKYEIAEEMLTLHSYMWYEISNWAQPGYESRHNLAYWRGGDVVALGCAAHGIIDSHRYSTPRHIDTYLDRFSPHRRAKPIAPSHFVSQNERTTISREEESFALKLRTRQGVEWEAPLSQNIVMMREEKFVMTEEVDGRTIISLLPKGRLMAHTLTLALFEEYDKAHNFLE